MVLIMYIRIVLYTNILLVVFATSLLIEIQ